MVALKELCLVLAQFLANLNFLIIWNISNLWKRYREQWNEYLCTCNLTTYLCWISFVLFLWYNNIKLCNITCYRYQPKSPCYFLLILFPLKLFAEVTSVMKLMFIISLHISTFITDTYTHTNTQSYFQKQDHVFRCHKK